MSEKKESICDSCVNHECIFQYGIYRETCDFYKPVIIQDIQDIKRVICLLQNFVRNIEKYEEEYEEEFEKGDKK